MVARSLSVPRCRNWARNATLLASTLALAFTATPGLWLSAATSVKAQEAISGREFEFSAPDDPSFNSVTPEVVTPSTATPEAVQAPLNTQQVEVPQVIYNRPTNNALPVADNTTLPSPPSTAAPTPVNVIPIPATPAQAQVAPVPGQGSYPQPYAAGSDPAIPTSYQYQRSPSAVAAASTPINRGFLPAGTTIPLAVYRQTVFQLHEPVQTNLAVVSDVTNRQGQVIIPAGSIVWGTFEPVRREETRMIGDYEQSRNRVVGSQFVAERIEIQSSSHPLSGRSPELPVSMDPTAEVDQVALRGAGYGAAGGVALGILTGGLGFLPMMAIGGASGAMASSSQVDRVVALQPNTTFNITLDEELLTR